MKKNYIAPKTEIVIINTDASLMIENNPYSDTTGTGQGNESVMDIEEDDGMIGPSKSLWD